MGKRDGQRQLALWISEASFARLKALAADEKTSQATVIESALEQYQPINEPARKALEDRLDELAGILADQQTRLKALETGLVMTRQPLEAGARLLAMQDEQGEGLSRQKLGNELERNQAVLELHRQQVSGRQISKRLGIGETTIRRILKKSAPIETPDR